MTDAENTILLREDFLKVLVGTLLFTLILWLVVNQAPKLGGVMLTFPALNGISLLFLGEDQKNYDLWKIAVPMPFMIMLNGILSWGYISLYDLIPLTDPFAGGLVAVFLGALGFSIWALFGTGVIWLVQRWKQCRPWVQAILTVVVSLTVSAISWWLTSGVLTGGKQCPPQSGATSVPDFFKSPDVVIKILAMAGSIFLVLGFEKGKRYEPAVIGSLGAFPLLPLGSLVLLYFGDAQQRTLLQSMTATVFLGPIVAIAFVFLFVVAETWLSSKLKLPFPYYIWSFPLLLVFWCVAVGLIWLIVCS